MICSDFREEIAAQDFQKCVQFGVVLQLLLSIDHLIRGFFVDDHLHFVYDELVENDF